MTERVSIIIPVVRPESAKRCVEAIKARAGVPRDQYEIVTAYDVHQVGCPEMVRKLTNETSYDWVMFLGDDTEPEQDFLKHAIDASDTLLFGGVVGLNTQDDRPGAQHNDRAHWMAHKSMLELIDGDNFFSTEYRHCWCDDELKDIAVENDFWTFAEKARIKHHHPINGNAPDDAAYGRAYSQEAQGHDYKTYLTRKIARTKKHQGTKLAVGLPLTDVKVYSHFFFSYLTLDLPDYDLFLPNYPGQIDAIRNDLVSQSLHKGCTHTLMMDTDQIYHDPDLVQRMLAHKKPVVGGMVHRRYPAFDPLVLRYDADKDAHFGVPDEEIESGDLVEVDATGCGCILFDNQVFLDMDRPWFELTTGKHGQTVGEDIGFCKKLKTHGVPIYVDTSLNIGHLALMEVDYEKYKLYQKLKG